MIIADTTISIAIIMKLSLLVSVSFFIPANIRNKMVSYNIPIVKKRKSLGVSLQSLFAHSNINSYLCDINKQRLYRYDTFSIQKCIPRCIFAGTAEVCLPLASCRYRWDSTRAWCIMQVSATKHCCRTWTMLKRSPNTWCLTAWANSNLTLWFGAWQHLLQINYTI